jgi:methionyl-tRNA formyltransferase
MKFLYLGVESKLIDFLKNYGQVEVFKEKNLDKNFVKKFDWIISYGYRFLIKKEILKITKNPIINLHISYLPYNRGADPNYWSFKEKSLKGVSIHKIDNSIDGGDIYVQKRLYFKNKETLRSSYNILKKEIEDLFIKNLTDIISGKIVAYKQSGKGTIHYKRQRPKKINYDIKVNEI